jgi:hypothetical protein
MAKDVTEIMVEAESRQSTCDDHRELYLVVGFWKQAMSQGVQPNHSLARSIVHWTTTSHFLNMFISSCLCTW